MEIKQNQFIKTDNQNEFLLPNFPQEFFDYQITPVQKGVSTEVYKLEKQNEQTKYLRINRHNKNFYCEVYAHTIFEKLGIKLPKIDFFYDNTQNPNQPSYIIISKMQGKPLEEATTLTQEQKEKILFNVGVDIAKINSVPSKKFGEIKKIENNEFIGGLELYEDFLFGKNNNIDTSLKELHYLYVLPKELKANLIIFYNKNKDLLNVNDDELFLNHGDICSEHIFCDENRNYTGLIDFSDVLSATQYSDLASIRLYEPQNFDYVLKGYESITQLPDDKLRRIDFVALMLALKKLCFAIKKNNTHQIIRRQKTLLKFMENLQI